VDNADLLAGAEKLGVSRTEVERLLDSLDVLTALNARS